MLFLPPFRSSGMVISGVPGSLPRWAAARTLHTRIPERRSPLEGEKGCSETSASEGARPGNERIRGGGGGAPRWGFGPPKFRPPPPHPDAGDELFPFREWPEASFPGAGVDPTASCCCLCERLVLPTHATRGGLEG